MKINRTDQLALASLIYENHFDGDEYGDDHMSMGSMDDGMGMDDEPSVDILSIDSVAPVEPFEHESEENNEQITADLKKLTEYVKRLTDICDQCDVEPWMVAKISKAAEYVSDIYYMLDSSADFANMGFDQASPDQSI